MKLKGFSIYGLFGEYDYNINLSEGYITFIHSLNGYGKSTIMRLIFDILKGDVDKISDINFQRMDLRFDDNTTLIVENDENPPFIQIQKNEIEEEIKIDDLRRIMSVLYIPPERSMILKNHCLKPALELYIDEIESMLRSAKEDDKLKAVPKKGRKEYNDAELEFWCKDMKAKLDFMKRVGLEPDMPAGFRFPPSRFEIMEYREEYEDLAFSVEDYIKKYHGLSESLIVYIDIANDLYINKEAYINESGLLSIKMNNGISLPLDKLSSGEKQILIMFYLLLFKAQPRSLVIIDEPEISLHVAWQQSLGKTFSDVARLRDLHIIVATHSPQVIHDNWDLAVELKVNNER